MAILAQHAELAVRRKDNTTELAKLSYAARLSLV